MWKPSKDPADYLRGQPPPRRADEPLLVTILSRLSTVLPVISMILIFELISPHRRGLFLLGVGVILVLAGAMSLWRHRRRDG